VRPYEAMVVLEPGLADDAMEAVLNRITGAITSQGGEVTHLDRWGKRRLAYEIGGHTEGYYVLIKFQGNPAAAIELDRILRITDPVMRHLIVREYTGRRKSAAAADQAPAAPATEVAGTAAEAEAKAGAEAGESTGGTGSGAQSK